MQQLPWKTFSGLPLLGMHPVGMPRQRGWCAAWLLCSAQLDQTYLQLLAQLIEIRARFLSLGLALDALGQQRTGT